MLYGWIDDNFYLNESLSHTRIHTQANTLLQLYEQEVGNKM